MIQLVCEMRHAFVPISSNLENPKKVASFHRFGKFWVFSDDTFFLVAIY